MFLERLEIHGFKSFAKKTILEFLPPKAGKMGITAIVGPNGSGKSCIADSVRWVLGEQSMRILRMKKSEDVIFFGSDRHTRLGMAEVSLKLNNANMSASMDMSEVVITRRLYRDGESEYLVNGAAARLSDIALLLARARFGQKFYTVIGQGLVDSILLASPDERKEFFDEAAGVKEFQLKRAQAVNKLARTKENLSQAAALVNEIEPRLRSLTRARRRLEERASVERELQELQRSYYGRLWHELISKLKILDTEKDKIGSDLGREQEVYGKELVSLSGLEKSATTSQVFLDLQRQYEALIAERGKFKEEELKIKGEMMLKDLRRDTGAAPSVSVLEMAGELEKICAEESSVLTKPTADKIKSIFSRLRELLDRIKKPAADAGAAPSERGRLEVLAKQIQELERQLAALSEKMREFNKAESENKSQFFDLQRELQARQSAIHHLEQHLNTIKIELARLETKRDSLENEINLETGPLASEIKLAYSNVIASEAKQSREAAPADLQPQIFRLKHQLALIGGIDPEAVKEYDEIKERYDFLTTQIADLTKALKDTEKAVAELDELMKGKREAALREINREFDRFFKMVFNGGSAKLTFSYEKVIPSPSASLGTGSEGDPIQDEFSESSLSELVSEGDGDEQIVGIEIQATPPGKRIKDINVLSGGERALTAVVLLCAILHTNPPPFVVLDEVDAALDESNSLRFAEILDQLSSRTQFIVITHNRATMSKANLLYGVTMGADGVSRLLSVQLEEAEKLAA